MEIEKGVPLRRQRKYPWASMDVGDSFFVAFSDGESDHSTRRAVSVSACKAGQRRGWKFATRKQADGVRVWRVE